MLNDAVLSDLDGPLFITKPERNNACLVFLHSWAHKMSLPFLGVCRVGFHVCNMLQETKGQMGWNNLLFSGGNTPFQCKIDISQQLGKTHPPPQQHQKGIVQREGLSYLLHQCLTAMRPCLTSRQWLSEFTAAVTVVQRQRHPQGAVEERTWKEIVVCL